MDIEEQYNRIYRYCYMKTRDHHTSEDLTQEKEDISSNTSFEQVEILDALERLEPLERELILLRYINE